MQDITGKTEACIEEHCYTEDMVLELLMSVPRYTKKNIPEELETKEQIGNSRIRRDSIYGTHI